MQENREKQLPPKGGWPRGNITEAEPGLQYYAQVSSKTAAALNLGCVLTAFIHV